MDGFDETKMKQLQLLKEKMKIAKAQKVEEVKNNEDVFSLSHDVKNVRSFETQDIRFNKIGKKVFDAFTPNKKVTHIKGTNNRFPFQQAKSGNANFPFKTKNGLIKLANESSAFDTPLTFDEVMRRKNEKKKRELEKSGKNGMVDDMLNNVRQFNLSEDQEEKNESGLLQGMHRTYQEEQIDQANEDSHAGNADVYNNMYSGSPLRELQETNGVSTYDGAGGLHQNKMHDQSINKEQASSGNAADNNHSINGKISNNTSSFGTNVMRRNQSLPHGMNSFNNYFTQKMSKDEYSVKSGADLNRTFPHGDNNVINPLSESFPGTSSAGGLGTLFSTRGDVNNRSGSNIFGCSLSKLNQSIFNQTVDITSSDQTSSDNINNGNSSSMTPSSSSVVKGEVGGESTNRLFQSSGNSTIGGCSIFGTHNAPIGSNHQFGTNNSSVPPPPNKSIETSSLFSRNDGNSNGINTGSLFTNSLSGNNLISTRNAPDATGKSGLFNNTNDNRGGNVFGKSKNNVPLFSGSGSIFGKSSSSTTNLFGIAASDKNPFVNTGIENNPIEKANNGKGIFGNVAGSNKPFGDASGNGNPFGSNIFGTASSASSNLFGKLPGGTNLFNKSGGVNNTNQFGNANNIFGKPLAGSNIFGVNSSLVKNVNSSLSNNGALLGDAVGGATVGGATVGGATVGGATVGGATVGGNPVGGATVSGVGSGNAQSTLDSRCNNATDESLVNTRSKLISDDLQKSSINLAPREGLTDNVGLSNNTNSVGDPFSNTNRFGLPNIVGSVVAAPSQGYLSRVNRGMQNNNDINTRVMKFKNTLSNIKSKRYGDSSEQIPRISGDNETQVDQTPVGDASHMGEHSPGEDTLGVEKNEPDKQEELLQYEKVEQGDSNKDVGAEPTCDNHSGESAKESNDNDKEESTNIRRTFSSYFNTFIPSIFSTPNKQAAKDEYPKGDASPAEVRTNNVEVNQNPHVNSVGKDASNINKLDTGSLLIDKEKETKKFFKAVIPLTDIPKGKLSSQIDGENTPTSNKDNVLLNSEKINEFQHFDPSVPSDQPNRSNHNVKSFRSQNDTSSHGVGEAEQMNNTETTQVLNLSLDIKQGNIVNPLNVENNKTSSLFNDAAASVPSIGAHPGVEEKMNLTVDIPFSNINAARSEDEVGALSNSVITPSLEEKSGRNLLLPNTMENVKGEQKSSTITSCVNSKVDEPRDIFQKDPSRSDLIEVANTESLENKEDFEKMNQIYKSINCINKNINYINKYVPSTIEHADNYLHTSISSVQNYDALSNANRTCLEKMNASNSSAQSNKELKNMISVLNKQMGKGGEPSGGEDDRGVPFGKGNGTWFCTPLSGGNQVDVTHNAKGGVTTSAPKGGPSKSYPIFTTTGKYTPGGNFVNTNMLTPREKLKLINETSKEIATNEESDTEEKIPEHVQKIMERREYFKTKNKLTNSNSNKSVGIKKIKPFVPSECSESFRNTFYTNENSKNKNNVFSLQNLSSMNILSPPHQGSSIDAAGSASYPTVDDPSPIFKESSMVKQNKIEKHIHSSSENFLIYKNMPPSSSSIMKDCNFSSENAQDGYNPFTPTKSFNDAVNSGEITSRVNDGRPGEETKPSGESLIKMEEEVNRQTDFISNIYASLGRNNFIYDNRGGMDSTDDKQKGDHRDDGVDPDATNTDDTPLKKRSLDNITPAHHDQNDDIREDEANPFDNVENGDENDPTCAQKKKRKFDPNGINEELVPKENRCIDISNCVKEIRDSRTLADISDNLSKYTLESERILCDIINDTFKMSLKISSLSDLPFLFEDFP
ncbi:conserved Plasmodium protein, unknown function [Plasmodium knowlesi strain H]|uniref:Uncharacterized protein n=3 Tax=Plasmodium knowlesi TaxID=5850 RepID=A0A5K1UCW9_PLAKH|nr:uncharacterized protein PKNH_1457200 [Plasmodium knowlesi strain H]OTN63869.1 Uncharacterized protein PKNOH_S140275700 [Plasmodium knowlesi]CAA9991169.1 conserved Plasmodium protein, unknown function [Plasmodium knowlesi strain H]SBO27141.1 conserved Plasmodium protein, unknown function [Plasmodium knowlesi strain H]SBO29376.1 conserved Plasmodium protein, unknown function [Plasmodium knowlesi strain H]VVS80643.1 conserved Plasmodium protein, unknown function [Plasmodium knowlesi strain H]|eukprot:XP_002262461.1 [Plasmodium knowlesi strain H]